MAELEAARTRLRELCAQLEQARAPGEARNGEAPGGARNGTPSTREREAILADARAEAAEIIRAAERERDHLLGEIRAAERRLRAAQTQIQQVLGGAPTGAGEAGARAPAGPPASPAEPAAELGEVESRTESGGRPRAITPRLAAAPGVPTAPHAMQLVFDNVPGYPQAVALERAIRALPEGDTLEVLGFERERLLLRLRVDDPAALAERVLAQAPLPLRLVRQAAEQVTFEHEPKAAPHEPKAALGGTSAARWRWGAYFAAIVAAELLILVWDPQVGMALHLAVLLALLLDASLGTSGDRPLLVALVLAPLVRVISLALPLAGLPAVYWYFFSSLPLFVAAAVAVRILGLSRRELGLRVGNLPLQLGIGLVGIPLGTIEYLILAPAPLIAELSWQAAFVPALILLVSTGFLEELIFRGVLQTTAAKVLGSWGVVYVSAVFAALHVGYLSVPDVAFVFAVGLGFAWLVTHTGSLLGVTLAHGLTNITLYLVLPLLAVQVGGG